MWRGVIDPSGGVPTYNFVKFSEKKHHEMRTFWFVSWVRAGHPWIHHPGVPRFFFEPGGQQVETRYIQGSITFYLKPINATVNHFS